MGIRSGAQLVLEAFLTMRFTLRARVLALGAVGMALAALYIAPASAELTAGAAAPASKSLKYVPETDASAWYWELQKDEEVGAGPAAQRVKLPNPQRPGTLPIGYENGEPKKLSALKFDLAARSVPAGSKVTAFQLTIVEEAEGGEAPTVNADGKVLQACGASSAWEGADEPELWKDKPEAADVCAKGKRSAPKTGEQGPVTWTFDLSTVAADWGDDPFENHGVVFSAVKPGEGAEGTWQINLKTPVRDNDATPEIDEAKQSANRVKATMTYLPGAGNQGGSGGVPAGGDAPGGGGAPGGGEPPAGDPPKAGPDSGDSPTPVAAPYAPRMPWYVWLLIPVALISAFLVRGALGDTAPAAAGAGVIEQIRRQNAARRGGPLPERPGLLARLKGGIAARRGRR